MGAVWSVLTNVERIAPCLPGAQLREMEGDEFRGIVKIKVGPITAQYQGAASFVERDDASFRAVLRAEGRDTRGAGNAAADITAELEETETGTRVNVATDLKVTGKVAQFGRGVMADVSQKLMSQFADNLSELIAGDDLETITEVTQHVIEAPDEVERVRVIDTPEVEALNLLDAAGVSIGKRVLPIVLAAAVVLAVVLLVL
ncbi:MAG TPA: carbon monoxide dehydrogenase [Acidimicrobiaceae bacterium]|nr:carbon monoxide dehydrogenase [Acidimicrobiaceae bacterium]